MEAPINSLFSIKMLLGYVRLTASQHSPLNSFIRHQTTRASHACRIASHHAQVRIEGGSTSVCPSRVLSCHEPLSALSPRIMLGPEQKYLAQATGMRELGASNTAHTAFPVHSQDPIKPQGSYSRGG